MPVTHEVEIGRPPTPDQLASWYIEHNITPDEKGVFTDLPYGPSPVEKSVIVEHVQVNALRHDIPNLQAQPFIPRTMVFVAGGPTLADHLEEVRAKCLDPAYDVFTSNATCKYLLAHGIIPKYHVIIDPTERKAKDLAYDCEDVTLVLGLQCHPAVFEARGTRKTFKFLAASATDRTPSDVDAAKAACTAQDPNLLGIGGGSMMGTRCVYLAEAMGYRRLEYYGFDACVKYENGRVRNYAYNKQRAENVLEVEAGNGKVYHSTLALSRQANEIVKLLDNLPGLDVVVHGDSFMANQVAIWKELNKPASYRISPEYHDLQRRMFEDQPTYATAGRDHAGRVFMTAAQVHRKHGHCDVLDYGAGRGSLIDAIGACFPAVPGLEYRGYDPNIPGLEAEPVPADIVYCGDVMEHIEPECVDTVLSHIHSLTRNLALFVISTRPAFKKLPDGRNAHISLHDRDWWMSFLKKYFVIIEDQHTAQDMIAVVQPIEVYRKRVGC